MKVNEIPYQDADARVHTTVKVYWDEGITKLSGLVRWRYLIIVDHLEFPDGSRVKASDGFKVFAQLKYSAFHSMFDARQGLVSDNPISASQIVSVPLRAARDATRQVSIFFSTWNTSNKDPAWSVAVLGPLTNDGQRADSTVL